ncbi:MAG: energy-coupling factor transporter transmembrane component T family protein [Fusobacteriaceae bacterium]
MFHRQSNKSFFHALHPVTKISVGIVISVVSIAETRLEFFAVLMVLLFIALYFSKIDMIKFVKSLKPILLIFLFTLAINIFFGTIMNSIVVFVRFFVMISFTSIIILTTEPIELTHGLEDFFSPLKKIKVPVAEMTLILSIALRFIPIFFEEAERIKNAQASKGYDVNDLNFSGKIKFYAHIMIPLISSAIVRAEDLANAMEIKGYSLPNKKTRFRKYHFRKLDILVFILIGAIILLAFIFKLKFK